MDTLKNMMGNGGENKPVEGQAQGQTGEQASSGGGFMDKINTMAGGGKESEAKEDYLDKGMNLCSSKLQSISNSCDPLRYRHVPRKGHGRRSSGQRIGYRAGKGRTDVRLHSCQGRAFRVP